MDVEIWVNTPAGVGSRRFSRRLHRIFPRLIGIVGTLIVHGFILNSTIFGSSFRENPIPKIERPANINPINGTGSGADLVLVGITNSNLPTELHQKLFLEKSLLRELAKPLAAQVAVSEPTDFDPSLGSEATVSASDDSEKRARLSGIYSTQIKARIERAWRKPRDAISGDIQPKSTTPVDDFFHCRANIIQDTQGNVLDISLVDCNGSSQWQRSVVAAIRRASPIPQPPDPVVFANTVTVELIGFAYHPGDPDDEYESGGVSSKNLSVTAQ